MDDQKRKLEQAESERDALRLRVAALEAGLRKIDALALRQARAEGMERAAKYCDELAVDRASAAEGEGDPDFSLALQLASESRMIAKAIRSEATKLRGEST